MEDGRRTDGGRKTDDPVGMHHGTGSPTAACHPELAKGLGQSVWPVTLRGELPTKSVGQDPFLPVWLAAYRSEL